MKVLNYSIMFFMLGVVFPAYADKCDVIKYNQCISCDDLYAFSVGSDEACAYLCPNREVNHHGSGSAVLARNCALKKCPENAPFQSEYGSCFATQEEAEKDFDSDRYDNINNDNIREKIAKKPQNGKCPEDFPLRYSNECYACDEIRELHISESECKKCANRIHKHYPKWRVESCELIVPKDKPLVRWDGAYFSCNEPKVIRVQTHCNIEEDCEDVCPNRTILYWVGGNIPSVPNCPKDKPLMDSGGVCYACDTPVPVGLEWNTKLCQRFCPDSRHLEGENCVLNK